MDRLRDIMSKQFETLGLSSEELSVDDVVKELMNELIPGLPASGCNGPAAKVNVAKREAEVAKVLQVIYGGMPEGSNHQSFVSEKIEAAKAQYMKGHASKDKASAAVKFAETLKERLVENLSERMRPLYVAKIQKLAGLFKEGKITRSELDQEMVQFINEARTVGFLFNVELENALSFIGNNPKDIINALYFLFKGDLGEEKNTHFERFDHIFKEACDAKFYHSASADEKRTEFRRALVSEARRSLANRLPDDLKKNYFFMEKHLQVKVKEKYITYDDYVGLIQEWLLEGSVNEAVNSILQSMKEKSAATNAILCHLCRHGETYNNATFTHKQVPNSGSYMSETVYLFGNTVFNNFDNIIDVNGGNAEKYRLLSPKLKENLLSTLASDQLAKIKKNQETLQKLKELNFIDEKACRLGNNRFILKLISGNESDFDAAESKKQLKIIEPYDRQIDPYIKAKLSLDSIFESGAKTEDILEGLIMCWGGNVENHRNGFLFNDLYKEKQEYLKIKTFYGNNFPVHFSFYEDFSIESRNLLFEKLPDTQKEIYAKRDQLLREHCKAGNITAEIYADAMVKFLHQLRNSLKTV